MNLSNKPHCYIWLERSTPLLLRMEESWSFIGVYIMWSLHYVYIYVEFTLCYTIKKFYSLAQREHKSARGKINSKYCHLSNNILL